MEHKSSDLLCLLDQKKTNNLVSILKLVYRLSFANKIYKIEKKKSNYLKRANEKYYSRYLWLKINLFWFPDSHTVLPESQVSRSVLLLRTVIAINSK